MFKGLKRVIFLFVCLCLSKVAWAQINSYELMLQDLNGNMLSEVSSLTTYNNYVFLIAQHQDLIYFVKENDLNDAFVQNARILKLPSLALTGELPKYISWEAISIGVKNGALTLFLTHEYDAEGDVHQAYQAGIVVSKDSVSLSGVSPFGAELPISTNPNIPVHRRANYGYESISWNEESQKLTTVSELSGQGVIFLSEDSNESKFKSTQHGFRISDMAMVSDSCAVFTSFCHTSDNICVSKKEQSILSILTARVSEQEFTMVDSEDISEQYLSVGFDPAVSDRADKGRLFNAEGIAMFKKGFLLVNDNDPQGKARTALRYIPSISVDKATCNIELQR